MRLNPQRVIPEVTDIRDLLRYRAARSPEKTAYAFLADGETIRTSLTYQELDRNAQAVAIQLSHQCLPGEQVLLAYPPGLDFIVAFFGCLYAGIVAVPVQLPGGDQTMDRWQGILASSQAKIVLTTSDIFKKYSNRTRPRLQTNERKICWIATDKPFPTSIDNSNLPEISGETLAFLQYTSGSTSSPKGVMVTHRNLIQNAAIIQEGFQLTSESKSLSWLPVYHDMGLIGGIIQPIFLGLTMILMSPLVFLQKPLRWLQAISRYRIVVSGAPNFAYELCVQKIKPEQRAKLDLSCWELAPVGAEPVRADTLENFNHAFGPSGFSSSAFYPCYGLAEATLFVAGGEKASPPILCQVNVDALEQNKVILEEDESKARTLVSHGQGKLDQKIILVDPKSKKECLAGQVGEIWISGSNISQGYWQHPHDTQETFQNYLTNEEGPFLSTGDLGFIHKGELFITGRLKEVMIIRGRNHYPQDIEHTIQQCHPALNAGGGAAFSVEMDGFEQLVVVQEVKREHLRKLDVKSIVLQIRRAVNDQHGLQVTEVVLVRPRSVLRTSSGKVRRQACREAFLAGRLHVAA